MFSVASIRVALLSALALFAGVALLGHHADASVNGAFAAVSSGPTFLSRTGALSVMPGENIEFRGNQSNRIDYAQRSAPVKSAATKTRTDAPQLFTLLQ